MALKTTIKAALVTRDAAEVPEWVLAQAESAGITVTARACTDQKELLECARDAEVVWTIGRNTVVNAEILPRLTRCRAIMRSGSGLDDLPVAAARRRGIKVLNTPEAIAAMVAEHTVALLFALTRQIVRHDREVRRGIWQSDAGWARWHVSGQTLGLVGFGLIARKMVGMVSGFGLEVLAYDPLVEPAVMTGHGVRNVDLPELLAGSDFVSLHCPLTEETRGLIGEQELRMMKETAFLINTSRGAVVNEEALIRALSEGWIAGAGLDVLEPEPPLPDNPLLTLENVIITPHVAAFSDQFEEKLWSASLAQLERLKNDC